MVPNEQFEEEGELGKMHGNQDRQKSYFSLNSTWEKESIENIQVTILQTESEIRGI